MKYLLWIALPRPYPLVHLPHMLILHRDNYYYYFPLVSRAKAKGYTRARMTRRMLRADADSLVVYIERKEAPESTQTQLILVVEAERRGSLV